MPIFNQSYFNKLDDFRHELKFINYNLSLSDISNRIRFNQFIYYNQYPDRWVNNIYFDNNNLDSMTQSIEGSYMRYKTRLRWYGDFHRIIDPRMEIKIKKGYLNTKLIYKCSYTCRNIEGPFMMDKINYHNPAMSNIFKGMRPIICNRYFRRYLISKNKKIRITIDTKLKFSSINKKKLNHNTWKQTFPIIVELKFDNFNNAPRNLMSYLKNNFSVTQISKYTLGCNSI